MREDFTSLSFLAVAIVGFALLWFALTRIWRLRTPLIGTDCLTTRGAA